VSYSLHRGAEQDLTDAFRFYKREAGRGVAARFLSEFERVVSLLEEFPQNRNSHERARHRQFKHGHKPGRVTVPGKRCDDLAPGTLNSILKQSGRSLSQSNDSRSSSNVRAWLSRCGLTPVRRMRVSVRRTASCAA
jgi:plasmid stabilization system protein ParE